jgi:hypothetical protein
LLLLGVTQIGWICQTMAIFGLPYDPEYYFAKVSLPAADSLPSVLTQLVYCGWMSLNSG